MTIILKQTDSPRDQLNNYDIASYIFTKLDMLYDIYKIGRFCTY